MSAHVLTIVGNRPQLVKAMPMSRELKRRGIRESLVHTDQHWDPEMSALFFDEFALPEPVHHLGCSNLGTDAEQVACMLPLLHEIILAARPTVVLVYGDTNSTLAGALAANMAGYPLAHVEAGLRSFDLSMPEERNRVLVDRLADYNFAPTDIAMLNLDREGLSGIAVGDLMFDTHVRVRNLVESCGARRTLDEEPKRYTLLTLHRRANRERGLLQPVLDTLALTGRVVFPVHPGTDLSGVEIPPNVVTMSPLSYTKFAVALRDARVVVTDSGGVQKEAAWYGTPCVTLREETEWPGTVTSGWNTLVGHSMAKLDRAVRYARNGTRLMHAGRSGAVAGVGTAGRILARLGFECEHAWKPDTNSRGELIGATCTVCGEATGVVMQPRSQSGQLRKERA